MNSPALTIQLCGLEEVNHPTIHMDLQNAGIMLALGMLTLRSTENMCTYSICKEKTHGTVVCLPTTVYVTYVVYVDYEKDPLQHITKNK